MSARTLGIRRSDEKASLVKAGKRRQKRRSANERAHHPQAQEQPVDPQALEAETHVFDMLINAPHLFSSDRVSDFVTMVEKSSAGDDHDQLFNEHSSSFLQEPKAKKKSNKRKGSKKHLALEDTVESKEEGKAKKHEKRKSAGMHKRSSPHQSISLRHKCPRVEASPSHSSTPPSSPETSSTPCSYLPMLDPRKRRKLMARDSSQQ